MKKIKHDTNVPPDFVIIGAQKAATTSLHESLRRHPMIYMPANKELGYFCREEPLSEGLIDYLDHFEGSNGRLTGEASTAYSSYIFRERVAPALYRHNCKMKVIYVLRDPIDRAISAFLYNVRDQVESLSLEQALHTEAERSNNTFRIDPYSYRRRGLYSTIVDAYLRSFPRRQLLLVKYEELIDAPAITLNEIATFLEIDETTKWNFPKSNVSSQPRSRFVHKLLTHPSGIRSVLGSIVAAALGGDTKRRVAGALREISKLNLVNTEYPPVPESILHELADFYCEHNAILQDKHGFDIAGWKSPIGKNTTARFSGI